MSDVLNRLKKFRATLYSLFPYRRDALFNLLDALTSRGVTGTPLSDPIDS